MEEGEGEEGKAERKEPLVKVQDERGSDWQRLQREEASAAA